MGLMDEAAARHAGEEFDEPYRPGPIRGPRRPFALPSISTGTLAAVVAALAVALALMLRGAPAPLAVAGDPTATPTHPSIPTAQPTPTLPPTSGPGRIAAWWAPGGERTPGDLALDAISGPIALCPTFPGLVQVAVGGEPGPWVVAEDAGIAATLVSVLPNAGGVCSPPTLTARPYVAPPPPAPVHVVATLEAPAVVVESHDRPTAGLPPTPCPIVLTSCQAPLVVAP